MQRDLARDILPGLACTVLPMGVAMQVSGKPPVTRAAEARYTLGTISRLSRKKGLDHLIAAAEALAARGQTPRLAIAGDGEDAARLRALVQAANVTFPGFLAGKEKQAFFDDCFAMALPSASAKGDVEGLPVALLEAMAAGKQIIASRDTNIKLLEEWPEISGAVDFLEDPSDVEAFADAIARMSSCPPEVAARNAGILARVADRYRWKNLIEEYLDVIENLPKPKRLKAGN
jgi:glycosyltransferase involved in cell wall biosynthesis